MVLMKELRFPPYLVILPPEQRPMQEHIFVSISYGSRLGPSGLREHKETKQPGLEPTGKWGFPEKTESIGHRK